MMRRPALIAVAGFVFGAAACSESKTGLRVSVDPATFKDAVSMQIVISALPGGFVAQAPDNMIGAYVKTETTNGHTMVAEVINNHDDPVTHVLATPWNLVSLAWGTAKCHNYSGWDYQRTSPVTVVCP